MPTVRRFATRTINNFELVSENEKGQPTVEKVTVIYRSFSQRLLDEIQAANHGDKISAYLSYQVARIFAPASEGKEEEDLTDDSSNPVVFYNGKPGTDGEGSLRSAREFFDGLDINRVTTPLFEAINADINPQKASSEGGQDG